MSATSRPPSPEASRPGEQPIDPGPAGFLGWVEDRLGLASAWERAMAYPVAGGARLRHGLGWALVALFLLQCLTGAALAAFYSPSVTDAWASVAYIERQVAGGAWLRGIHHFGTGAMVVLSVLHALDVAIRAAYRRPREPNWWVGLALLALVLAYPLTGYTLLWDQLALWSSKVRTGILGSLPGVGSLLRALALGGNDHGNLTLTRTYALHVAVLPGLTFLLLFLHLRLFRRSGYAAPEGSPLEPYGARQLALDLLAAAATIGGVLALGALYGARLSAPAAPTVGYPARPEWYFLPLFQLLKLFDGPLQIVGTVVVPALVGLFLVSLPLLDRSGSGRARAPWLGGLFGLLALALALGGQAVSKDAGDADLAEQRAHAEREARRALALSEDGVPVQGAAFMMAHDPLVRGERVFRRRCLSCHGLEGFVPEEPKGPDLTAYRSKAWLRQLLRDPEGPRFFGHTEIRGMPSFADLSEAEMGVLVDMLYGLRDEEGVDITAHPASELVAELECADCHDYEDDFAYEGPTMRAYLAESWVRAMVDHPDVSHLYGDANEMPAFERKLSDEDRAAVVRFLLALEDRAPRDAWPYVDEPVVTSPREDAVED